MLFILATIGEKIDPDDIHNKHGFSNIGYLMADNVPLKSLLSWPLVILLKFPMSLEHISRNKLPLFFSFS